MARYPDRINDACVFCEIVAGALVTPGIFWQDEEFIAF